MTSLKIPKKDFIKLHNRFKICLRITGSEYGNAVELDRIFNTKKYTQEVLNPSLPQTIIMHTNNGIWELRSK